MAKQGSRSLIMSSDIVYDLACDICAEDDKNFEAAGYCTNCRDYLCQECFNAHQRSKPSRNHVLLDKGKMPRQKPSLVSPIATMATTTEKCPRHTDRPTEYHCRDHRELGCSACMIKSHRACQNLVHIPDVVDNLLNSQQYRQFKQELDTLKARSKDVIKTSKNNVAISEKYCIDAAQAVQVLRKKMNDAYDKLERGMKTDSETIKTADLKKMKDVADQGSKVVDDVEKISAELQSLQKKKQLGQLFIQMIKHEDTMGTLHGLLSQAEADNYVTAYTFEPGPWIPDILHEPASIGKLYVQTATGISASPSTSPLQRISGQGLSGQGVSGQGVSRQGVSGQGPPGGPTTSAAPPTAKDPGDGKAVKVRDISVKIKSDNYLCWISGSTLLPGNKLVLADYNNKKVKLLDLNSNKVTSKLQVSDLWDVTTITTDQVAVTLCDERKIAFVKVTDRLRMDREMSVGGRCTGILHNNGKMIVAFADPVKIEIMALGGIVQKKIEQPGLFKCPDYVALCPGRDVIYVSDRNGNCVKRVTLDGDVEAVYTDERLEWPRGVVVDQHGRVLVCGTLSGTIHLISRDLSQGKVLIDGLWCPCSLSLCHSSGTLYLGREDDAITVYQLS